MWTHLAKSGIVWRTHWYWCHIGIETKYLGRQPQAHTFEVTARISVFARTRPYEVIFLLSECSIGELPLWQIMVRWGVKESGICLAITFLKFSGIFLTNQLFLDENLVSQGRLHLFTVFPSLFGKRWCHWKREMPEGCEHIFPALLPVAYFLLLISNTIVSRSRYWLSVKNRKRSIL